MWQRGKGRPIMSQVFDINRVSVAPSSEVRRGAAGAGAQALPGEVGVQGQQRPQRIRSLSRELPGFRVLIGLSCGLLLLQWFWASSKRPDPLVVTRAHQSETGFLIDVNQAGWVEWMQLEGPGQSHHCGPSGSRSFCHDRRSAASSRNRPSHSRPNPPSA
jgi:hypothetical protein